MTKLSLFLGVTVLIFLSAASSAVGSCVLLKWVATGDDGYVGTAYRYDIRFSPVPMNEDLWDTYPQVSYVPLPAPSGTQQMVPVGGLEPGRFYYFAMKAADEFFNWSPMSNVVLKIAPPDFGCTGEVGNANCDSFDAVTLSDISSLVGYIFIGYPCCCPDEANANGDPDGELSVGDIARLIDYLFITGDPLPTCEVR